jgi:iron complex transport system substrate-binding protein
MVSKKILLIVAMITAFLVGCGASPSAPAPAPTAGSIAAASPTPVAAATAAPAATVITDSAGRKVALAGIPQRIVSLAPSNTEILFALDLSKQVVGVDSLSDYPADAKKLTQVGGSGNQFNFEQIVALKPDLVLAASLTTPEAVKKLDDLKIPVAVIGTTNTTFDGVMSEITLVAQMTGKSDKAKTITDAMRQRIDAVKAKAAAAKTKPRVYWELDATDPTHPFSVGPGNFINDIITTAAGTNVFANAGNPFPQVSAENIIAANPEVIIMSDAAYGVTTDSLTKRKGWQVIAAVKNKTVLPIDDNLVSRPGPRVVDGLEAAAKLIHPELFK